MKVGVDAWLTDAQLAEGRIFRSVAEDGKVVGLSLSERAVWSIVQQSAEEMV